MKHPVLFMLCKAFENICIIIVAAGSAVHFENPKLLAWMLLVLVNTGFIHSADKNTESEEEEEEEE